MLRLLLVRHGQTEWNLSGRNQGHADVGLDDVGKRQATELSAALARESVDYIYASPLSRVTQTIAPLQKLVSVNVTLDDRLKERSYGEWEGLTAVAARELDADAFDRYHDDPTTLAPSGGESGIDVFCRAGHFLHDLLALHTAGCVGVCSHGGTISSMIAALVYGSPATASAFRIRNCSITEITVQANGRRRLVRFDDVGHLQTPPIETAGSARPAN